MRIAAAVSALIFSLALFASHSVYRHHYNGPPIRSDGFGYYAYVTSILVDGDLSFATAAKQHADLTPYGMGVVPETGRMFNKYSPGTAVLEAPFFLGARAASGVLGYSNDGYSAPFQVANVVSGAFYLAIGSFFLVLLLLRNQFPPAQAIPAVLLIVFATNVFHYSTYDASFSHVYSFCSIALLLLLLDRYRRADSPSLLLAVSIGATLGLLILIRVPNVIVGLLPIIVMSERFEARRFIAHSFAAATAGLLFLLPLPLYWMHSAGRIAVNSYAVLRQGSVEEGFTNWKAPQILNFLFSVDRGFFFWSPIAIVAVLGLVLTWRRDRRWALATGVILILQIYLCSSWWTWQFGASFGSRPMVDMMPLLAIPLADVLRWRPFWTVPLGGLLVVIETCLMIGYWRGFIPFGGTTPSILKALPWKLLS